MPVPKFNADRDFFTNIVYDKATDSPSIHLTYGALSDWKEINDGVVFDFAASDALVGIDVRQASPRAGLNNEAVKCTHLENEDTLHIRLSDKPIVRELSTDWHTNTNISYIEDGSIVEIVLLDAKKNGLLLIEFRSAA